MNIFETPDIVRTIPIERFPLKARAYKNLAKAGIRTFEELVGTLRTGQTVLPDQQQFEIRAIVVDFRLTLHSDGSPDWPAFFSRRGLPMIPEVADDATDRELFDGLSKTFKEILIVGSSDHREWEIVQFRIGLNGKKVMTLEELGQAFGRVSRERIRQLEKRSLDQLRESLLEENLVGKAYVVNKKLIDFVQRLRDFARNGRPGFVTESELVTGITREFSLSPGIDLNLLRLLLNLFGMSEIRELPSGVPTVWKVDPDFSESRLRKVLQKLQSILTTDYTEPFERIELLAKLNRSLGRFEPLSIDGLHRYVALCDFIETTEEGCFQAKFEAIRSRSGQAERILVEANEMLHTREIVKRVNERLIAAGQKSVEMPNIANIMSSEKRFVAEAKSGRRGLKRWGAETKSITRFMVEALSSVARPMTLDEIYEYVRSRRPVKRNSISIYLNSDSRFQSGGFGKWKLAAWGDKDGSTGDSKSEIAAYVKELFESRGVSELPYPEVATYVAERLGVAVGTARGTLKYHPVVKSRRIKGTNKTIAIFNPGYKTQLAAPKPKRKRKKETLFQKAEKLVRGLLQADPAGEVELSVIRAKLVSELGCPDKTAYQYVSKLDFVEKVPVEGTTVRICKLKGNVIASYPKLVEIKALNSASGEEAERAIAKLNDAEVDIGLFMLGRLFESSLKNFLRAAKDSGNFEISDGNLAKLNNMIQWIEKEGIVSDGPTLAFLRTMRNDRAHGDPPTLEERNRLLESAPWGANLYLLHILLFEQKKKDLTEGTSL